MIGKIVKVVVDNGDDVTASVNQGTIVEMTEYFA